MLLRDILSEDNGCVKVRRKNWYTIKYLTIAYDYENEGDSLVFMTDYRSHYALSVEDVMADDWEEYNSVGYVSLYMQEDGIPGHYVISEEEYNNKQWPDFPYMTDWIRFDSELRVENND
jgi:hypothetical protein